MSQSPPDPPSLVSVSIEDCLGLSKPLTKLVETISKGVGRLCAPLLVKSDAKARAEEIRVISEAIADGRGQLGAAFHYSEGAITISQPAARDSCQERARARLDYQEARRQLNIEAVTSSAVEETINGDDVGDADDTPVDEDWITRFFAIAQDVTNADMQKLWGRILVGEVRRPGAFPLRSLEVLRNMTQSDADTFSRLATLAIGTSWVARPNPSFLETVFNISVSDLLQLEELGLISPRDDLGMQVAEREFRSPSGETVKALYFSHGGHDIIGFRPKRKTKPIGAVVFTSVGRSLLGLVPRKFERAYVEALCSEIGKDAVESWMYSVDPVQPGDNSYRELAPLFDAEHPRETPK